MRSVLLLTVDSLRADHLSVHGHERETTPRIDELAREGIDHRRAFSQGTTTSMSFLSLLGGIYPLANGAWMDSEPRYPRLSPTAPALAEVLSESGLVTGAWHSNPLLSRFHGYSRGFTEFHDPIPEGAAGGGYVYRRWHRRRFRKAIVARLKRSPRLYGAMLRAKERIFLMERPFEPASALHQRAARFIGEADGPFFAWIHYMDLHYPYLPGPSRVREFTGLRISKHEMNGLNRTIIDHRPSSLPASKVGPMMALYDTQLNVLDAEIGRFLDALDGSGHLDGAVVVLTADHGDQFMEHGHVGHWNNVWYYDELLHVPLIVRGAGKGVRDGLAALVDVPPSICRWAGVEPHPDMMGRPMDVDREMVFAEGEMDGVTRVAVRTVRRKFIWDVTGDSVELYDLDADPGEKRDMAPTSPEGVEAFRGIASAHLDEARRHQVRMAARRVSA
ncbi:MAG: sulfatase-like hydrolase/transferase [Thermoplasmata archaeon]|nr:sulfatase-like hydrolase/transferase [Thermoplasmata archaeon]